MSGERRSEYVEAKESEVMITPPPPTSPRSLYNHGVSGDFKCTTLLLQMTSSLNAVPRIFFEVNSTDGNHMRETVMMFDAMGRN